MDYIGLPTMSTGPSGQRRSQPPRHRVRWLAGLVAVMLVVSACGASQPEPTAATNPASSDLVIQPQSVELPNWILNGSQKVQAAYTAATLHAAELAYIPCYCSCGQFGHESVADCFISGTDSTGAPVYDDHAYYWDLCLNVALDATTMLNEGRSLTEVRAQIEARYGGRYGPPTDAPLPPGG